MALELVQTPTLRFKDDNGNRCWQLKDSDFEQIGDEQFLKVPRGGLNLGFSRLVAYKCPDVPESKDAKKAFSLTTSKGYAKLLEMRNSMQADHMKA